MKKIGTKKMLKYSTIYIYSDGPKKGDEKIVSEIRKYINSIEGFIKTFIGKANIINWQFF